MNQSPQKPRLFTGRHMWFVMLGFFGTIIVVNLIMARFALSTFGGTIVDNSYVASQQYNDWLEDAREQEKLGWTVSEPVRDVDSIALDVTTDSGPLEGAAVTAEIEHPLGHLPGQSLTFIAAAPGRYVSMQPVPAGRWRMRIDVVHNGHDYIAVRDLR